VNDAAALQCHQCGTAFEATPGTEPALTAACGTALEATPGTEAASTAATQGFARNSGPGARDLSREVHVPESFASRYGLILDDANRPQPRGDPPADVHPREHEIAGSPSLVAVPRRESSARNGNTSSGVLLVIALLVMVAGGYYGYRHWAAPVGGSDVAAPGAPSAREPTAAQTEAVAPAPAPGATAPAQSSPSTPVTATAPAQSSPSTPVTTIAPMLENRDTGPSTPPENVTNAPETTASPESPAEVSAAAPAPSASEQSRPSRVTSSKGGATNRRASTPASETQRIIDRELGKTGVARGARPEAANDLSAIETQRIIERELGTRAASPGAAAADANRR
jgi:hypothetical protein